MKVSLRFEDLFALQQNLKWEFKDITTVVTVDSLKKTIHDSFNEAANTLGLDETPPFPECEVEIRLLMRGLTENKVLAYFDMSNLITQSIRFSFKLYADVLFPLLKSGDLQPLKSIWLHEIMHMIDYSELLKNLKIYREKMNDVPSQNFSLSFNEIRKDKHIILLQILMQFRAEGIATLVEYIMGGSNDLLDPPHLAKEQFDQIVTKAVSLIYSVDFDSRQLAGFIKEITPFSYQIGAGLVLYGLMNKYPEISGFAEIEQCLVKRASCHQESDKQLIRYISSFDSFDFLKYSFEQESLYEKVWELTSNYAENLNLRRGFFTLLSRIRKFRDRGGFLALLRTFFTVPLSFQQIEEMHNKIEVDYVIPLEIRENSNSIYEHLKQNPSDDFSSWVLTYVYSNRDLLDDSIDYFGFIDDMEVLETAITLID